MNQLLTCVSLMISSTVTVLPMWLQMLSLSAKAMTPKRSWSACNVRHETAPVQAAAAAAAAAALAASAAASCASRSPEIWEISLVRCFCCRCTHSRPYCLHHKPTFRSRPQLNCCTLNFHQVSSHLAHLSRLLWVVELSINKAETVLGKNTRQHLDLKPLVLICHFNNAPTR